MAVIDSGVDLSHPELVGRISPLSTDVFPGRNTPDRGSSHGTRVSTVIAANYDGAGTVGVAYQSTILSIRADDSAGVCDADGCSFEDRDLAAAIDYAVASGAQIINLSIGGSTPDNAAFEAALQRAVNAGLVVTASAGNDTSANPEWPARYSSDPRYMGAVMAVGASAQDGSMASFSGLAGVAANGFLVAPGENIVTDCTSSGCWVVSGTSFSSPIVAGALALLLDAFPMLSGRDAVDILYRTATDKGAPGVDPVWGRGLLDLRAAFQPVGTLGVPMATGEIIAPTTPPGSMMGSAFGDAVRQSSALTTFGRDDYRRIYKVDMADAFPGSDGAVIGTAAPATRRTAVTMTGPVGARLSIQAEQPVFEEGNVPEQMLDFTGARQPTSAAMTAQMGRLGLVAWRGEGGAQAPGADERDAFRTVAAPDQMLQASLALGKGWSLVAEQGSAERMDIQAFRETEAGDYASASARYDGRGVSAVLTAGWLDERRGPLGSDLSPGSAFSMPAETRFSAISLSGQVSKRMRLRAEGAFGRTRIEDGFFRTDAALSSQWRLGAYGDCGLIGLACDVFALELEQPLRIESGVFSAVLADVPADWRDPTTYSARRFSASPSGREIDLRLILNRDFGAWGLWRLRTVAAFNDGHRSDADIAVGGAVDWRLTF